MAQMMTQTDTKLENAIMISLTSIVDLFYEDNNAKERRCP
jgi:hypothetical protein